MAENGIEGPEGGWSRESVGGGWEPGCADSFMLAHAEHSASAWTRMRVHLRAMRAREKRLVVKGNGCIAQRVGQARACQKQCENSAAGDRSQPHVPCVSRKPQIQHTSSYKAPLQRLTWLTWQKKEEEKAEEEKEEEVQVQEEAGGNRRWQGGGRKKRNRQQEAAGGSRRQQEAAGGSRRQQEAKWQFRGPKTSGMLTSSSLVHSSRRAVV